MRSPGIEGDRLLLLWNVSGAFRPGILTALVGLSGAGKTTLTDVWAGRKAGGYIEGSTIISGYPKNQATSARISGYFEAWTLKHEGLLLEILELVELNKLRDALVSLPGVDGLLTERRKRLTIAVELVANPSIIFMDEPISRLEARAAAIVMRTLRNTVDTGRTVLLLMKRGGQVIYAGPLCSQSHKLIEYLEGIPGIPKIKYGHNPATWMHDVTAPQAEFLLGVDFAEPYANSSLYQKNQQLITQLSNPAPDSRDLYFHTQCSQTFLTQCKACFWKQHWSHWRNPPYNAAHFILTWFLVSCLVLHSGTGGVKVQELTNLLGVVYSAVLFLMATHASAVQAVVDIKRTAFYCKRAAGMYSALPYAFAQVMLLSDHIAFLWSFSNHWLCLVCDLMHFALSCNAKIQETNSDLVELILLGFSGVVDDLRPSDFSCG
ncbi:hypothetical protein Nepgr_032000 [Nepenthes gracilis]|uniref:ABC transporter domain-containing protein n=1 Tax=Nepenthes gracilis TaxID=150966 RepID=A0AAD3TIL2_NEPGR|nr:hypothetical protein Nepgr_032000 [Nepenthes gracilis]